MCPEELEADSLPTHEARSFSFVPGDLVTVYGIGKEANLRILRAPAFASGMLRRTEIAAIIQVKELKTSSASRGVPCIYFVLTESGTAGWTASARNSVVLVARHPGSRAATNWLEGLEGC